ncbi:MAG: hypothetical protein KC432_08450 [Thermomicrobiales bacterium]|nr:hypothetical protein [Thermomicrobiales bacterium]
MNHASQGGFPGEGHGQIRYSAGALISRAGVDGRHGGSGSALSRVAVSIEAMPRIATFRGEARAGNSRRVAGRGTAGQGRPTNPQLGISPGSAGLAGTSRTHASA